MNPSRPSAKIHQFVPRPRDHGVAHPRRAPAAPDREQPARPVVTGGAWYHEVAIAAARTEPS